MTALLVDRRPRGPRHLDEPPAARPPSRTVRDALSAAVGSLTTTTTGLLLVAAAVSVTLGVYGGHHQPAGAALTVTGVSAALEAKVWLTVVAGILAGVQALSILAMSGRLPGVAGAPAWNPVHRWSGRVAFLLTVPVAVHCLYALGLQTSDTRVLLHGLLGCLFYGAFTAKMLALGRPGLPGVLLPVLGGIVLTALVIVCATSALWFLTAF